MKAAYEHTPPPPPSLSEPSLAMRTISAATSEPVRSYLGEVSSFDSSNVGGGGGGESWPAQQ